MKNDRIKMELRALETRAGGMNMWLEIEPNEKDLRTIHLEQFFIL